MEVVNPRLFVSQAGERFDLIVEYTATFVPQEANFVFEDWVRFFERDSGEDFDSFDPNIETPREEIRPNGQTSIFRRRQKLGVTEDNLDTGFGDEDLVGFVNLRNVTLNGQPVSKRTPITVIDA